MAVTKPPYLSQSFIFTLPKRKRPQCSDCPINQLVRDFATFCFNSAFGDTWMKKYYEVGSGEVFMGISSIFVLVFRGSIGGRDVFGATLKELINESLQINNAKYLPQISMFLTFFAYRLLSKNRYLVFAIWFFFIFSDSTKNAPICNSRRWVTAICAKSSLLIRQNIKFFSRSPVTKTCWSPRCVIRKDQQERKC